MQFLFPAFLTAAFVIAIPIIIHLFNFRRYKKVFFTNVAFLRSIQQTSNSRKKVQQWLVLACRCLALIALVMAFAQPFFETKGKVKQGTNYSFIYLDNSFSMGASTSEDNLLEKAKETAHQIVSGFGADDKFQIITNNLEGGQQQWLNKEEANAVIDEKVISPQFKTFSQIFKTIQQNFKISGQGKYNAFFLSDFQVNAADLAKLKDTSI
ncbi:MAG: BatA domain-containing protein, partial [Saprospiraceae bacterium]